MFRLMSSLVLCLVVVTGLAGCPSEADRPATVPATATVTYNGEAIEGAHVTFSPDSDSGDAAFGDTDPEGKADLRTSFAQGAVPGSYKVAVTKTEAEAVAGLGPGENEDEEVDEDEQDEGGDVVYKSVLPEKYGSADTSGFTATVTEGGENAFTFDLVD